MGRRERGHDARADEAIKRRMAKHALRRDRKTKEGNDRRKKRVGTEDTAKKVFIYLY